MSSVGIWHKMVPRDLWPVNNYIASLKPWPFPLPENGSIMFAVPLRPGVPFFYILQGWE